MAKAKTSMFFCSECGFESAKWTGQCPACKSWNTMVEEPVSQVKTVGKGGTSGTRRAPSDARPVTLSEIVLDEEDRIRTGFEELDRVLGSGIVRGSLVLVGGDPGIGKSTLLFQA